MLIKILQITTKIFPHSSFTQFLLIKILKVFTSLIKISLISSLIKIYQLKNNFKTFKYYEI